MKSLEPDPVGEGSLAVHAVHGGVMEGSDFPDQVPAAAAEPGGELHGELAGAAAAARVLFLTQTASRIDLQNMVVA